MEIKKENWQENKGRTITRRIGCALLTSFVVTGLLWVLLSFLLYRFYWSEKQVEHSILVIYFLSAFAGGLFLGRTFQKRRFFWGLAGGFGYFFSLLVVSLLVFHSFQHDGGAVLRIFLICQAGGVLGGVP